MMLVVTGIAAPRLLLRILLVGALCATAGTMAQAAGLSCVIELFTSQGCSSCPPADALLGRLAREPGILAVSFPVDYWDYIGWKDTLASHINTERQEGYAAVRGDGQVYTPQVVVDGLRHAVGSDEGDIRQAIGALQKRLGPLSVDLALSQNNDLLKIEVGATPSNIVPRTASLWLLRIAKATTVQIGRGENAGRTVTYTNVVRSMAKVGEWMGAPASFEVPLPRGESYAVLLQAGSSGRPGMILAAAKGGGL